MQPLQWQLAKLLTHLECDTSKVFWANFVSWWNCKNNTQIKVHQRDTLSALHPGKHYLLGTNYCLLVATNYF